MRRTEQELEGRSLEDLENMAGHATGGFYFTMEQCTIMLITMMLICFGVPLSGCIVAFVANAMGAPLPLAVIISIAMGALLLWLLYLENRSSRRAACLAILVEGKRTYGF